MPGVLIYMDGLTSQVAIEEFMKQGIHNRKVWRRAWPLGDMLVHNEGTVARGNADGIILELTPADYDATDWALDESEFL